MKPNKDRRLISRRKFLKYGATALGGLTLAACGRGGTAGEGEPEAGTEAEGSPVGEPVEVGPGQTKITAWFWDDSLQLAVDAFHEQQDKIRVEFIKQGYEDTHQRLLTSIAAGGGAADVVAIEIGKIGAFAARGGLVNLLDAPYDAGQFKEDMVEYKWIQGSTEDGRLIALPWDIGPAGLWYLADVLEEAGIDPDPEKMQERIKTWDDWLQLAEDLKNANANTRLFADAFQDILTPMVEQQGHGWVENNKLVIEEKLTKPLQRAAEARQRELDAQIEWWGPEWYTALKNGDFAGMGIACWMQTGLTRDAPETVGRWRVIRAPEGDYNMGGSFLSIPEQTQNKEAAWEFVKFVCATAEGQNTIFKAAGIFPAYKPAWEDPIYDEPVEFFGGQRTFRLWLDISQGVPGNVVHPADQQISEIVGTEVDKVKNQGKDPAQAAQDAEAEALNRIQGLEA